MPVNYSGERDDIAAFLASPVSIVSHRAATRSQAIWFRSDIMATAACQTPNHFSKLQWKLAIRQRALIRSDAVRSLLAPNEPKPARRNNVAGSAPSSAPDVSVAANDGRCKLRGLLNLSVVESP
jgi:hypothetical protein